MEVPARRDEIIAYAIREREREQLSAREVRGLMALHPLQTLKVTLISGLIAFVLAWIFSELIAIGHWYSQAKAYSLNIDIPLVGKTALDIGSHVPTSTELGIASQFPVYGIREVGMFAIGVMLLILLEKIIVAIFHFRDSRELKRSSTELKKELETLKAWSRKG